MLLHFGILRISREGFEGLRATNVGARDQSLDPLSRKSLRQGMGLAPSLFGEGPDVVGFGPALAATRRGVAHDDKGSGWRSKFWRSQRTSDQAWRSKA